MGTSVVTTWLYVVAATVALAVGDGGSRIAAAVVLAFLLARTVARRVNRESIPTAAFAVRPGPLQVRP